jgi:hypothetical protein
MARRLSGQNKLKQVGKSSTIGKVLLVGNGINADSPGYKWADLVRELIKKFGRKKKIEAGNKPFPLLYEEIVLKSGNKILQEKAIKDFIAEKVQSIEPNRIHEEIANASFASILTTNYDYSLETALGAGGGNLKNAGAVKETRYSLFRHSVIGSTKLWHIHGEASSPPSILLGYEQYCGYLQYMRNYVVTGTGESYKNHIDALGKRMQDGKNTILSWVDYFFLGDVYVLGLTMDFVEMHLWWILTYRARAMRSGLLPIHNKVVFFVPRQYVKENKERFQLLESCGVSVLKLTYKRENRLGYYGSALKIIAEDI